jgi:hypothetical protein
MVLILTLKKADEKAVLLASDVDFVTGKTDNSKPVVSNELHTPIFRFWLMDLIA